MIKLELWLLQLERDVCMFPSLFFKKKRQVIKSKTIVTSRGLVLTTKLLS